MNKGYKILLNKEKSVLSTNINEEININIENTTRPLPLGDVEHTVNAFEQFEKERAESTKYRFYGTINPMISNMLYNDNVDIISGNTGVVGKKILSDRIFLNDGWYGTFFENNDTSEEGFEYVNKFNDNSSTLCAFTPFDPGYERLNILDTDGIPNYMLKLTYPYSTKDITLIENNGGITLANGIPIIKKIKISINDRLYTGFKTPINHGLDVGDEIKMYNFQDPTGNLVLSARTISIFSLGNQVNDDKERIFVVDINPSEIDINIGISTIKRSVIGVESEYYVRSFSALTTNEIDYDLYPAAFGKNYFNDQVAAFYFKNDIDIKNIRDNLGRPLSEIYLTIIKQGEELDPTNYNHMYWIQQQSGLTPTLNTQFWTPIAGGYSTEKNADVNYNIRAFSDSAFPQNYYTGIDISATTYDADIVEYNSNVLLEKKLEDVYHRINTVYRENRSTIIGGDPPVSNLTEGYIYQPHKKMQIREFSDFIEEGDTINTVGIPDYSTSKYSASTQSLATGPIEPIPLSKVSRQFKWRDLLDIGFIDSNGFGVDYPFESGAHYLNIDTRFYLQRQDPPCGRKLNSVETSYNKETFPSDYLYLLYSPNFYQYEITNAEELNNIFTNTQQDWFEEVTSPSYQGNEFIEMTLYILNYVGDYGLGSRYTPGGCLDFSSINQKTIDDEC